MSPSVSGSACRTWRRRASPRPPSPGWPFSRAVSSCSDPVALPWSEPRRGGGGCLSCPGLFVAFAVAVWTLGQAVAATNVPPTSVGSATPADRGMSYRDVEFETADGVALSGWYVPSTNGAAVVLMHGAGSTRSGVLDQAAVLADHGFGVLLFDARGHGRSGGRAMDFGWYGDQDTSAAVSFLQAQPDVDDQRIAAMGMSMGGEQAIGAAAADPRIGAVVAEGATNRVAGDKAWLSEQVRMAGRCPGADRLVDLRHHRRPHSRRPADHAPRRGRRLATTHPADRRRSRRE